MANAAGNALLTSSPQLAHQANPLSADARIRLVADRMANADPFDAQALSKVVEDGVRIAPADARLLSLLGIIKKQQGHDQEAQKLFQRALTMLPTEIQALLQRFVYFVAAKDYVAAVEVADVVSRRWRKHWRALEPYLPLLLSNEAAMRAAALRFAVSRHGQNLLITSLSRSPETLALAIRLIDNWRRQGIAGLWPSANQITRRLVAEKRYAEAYFLFRSLLNEQQDRDRGYVFNAEFSQQPTGNPFDWQLDSQAGVSMRIIRLVKSAVSGTNNAGDDGRALQIKFLDNPVQFNSLSQHVRLVPGSYSLAATYQATELRAPKPLFLAVECIASKIKLTVLPFESGTRELSTISNDFRIPDRGCDLQRIHVFNEFLARSWSNRYSGRLTLDRITIRKRGG